MSLHPYSIDVSLLLPFADRSGGRPAARLTSPANVADEIAGTHSSSAASRPLTGGRDGEKRQQGLNAVAAFPSNVIPFTASFAHTSDAVTDAGRSLDKGPSGFPSFWCGG